VWCQAVDFFIDSKGDYYKLVKNNKGFYEANLLQKGGSPFFILFENNCIILLLL